MAVTARPPYSRRPVVRVWAEAMRIHVTVADQLGDHRPMTTGPDILRLSIVRPPPDEGLVEVRPIVNGRVVPGGVGGSRYLGAGPRHLLGQDGLLHATATPHEVRLAWSGCGVEECCGALYVTVTRDGDHVVWAGWRDPSNEDVDLPELRFTAGQYDAEMLRAGEDRSWEWPAGAVARLLEAGLRRHEDWLVRWDCALEGVLASRKEPDRIHVVLLHPRDRADADLPWLQFGMTLPISSDPPSDQAEHLEGRLTAGDPRAAAEVWGGSHDAEQLGYPWPPVDPLSV
ncbi:hypothetical protein [Streptomyces sp. 11x1]|uniref:hypothetical protein n=1 Tax=Streptomyces sp. 11x1 TaxID=3038642 RepID=UPI002931A217|nr:hypothetical protein [Streptomyces sp. 11x1]WNZ06513.1 hypothetical protein P8T65_02165 [Streptomyces sp. 11x1]